MSEETNISAETTSDSSADSPRGDQSQATGLIERTDSYVKRLEEENKKAEERIKALELLYAKTKLGGVIDSGQAAKAPSAQDEIDRQVQEALNRFKR